MSKQELGKLAEDAGRVRRHLGKLLSQYGSLALNPTLPIEMHHHHFDMNDFKDRENELMQFEENPFGDLLIGDHKDELEREPMKEISA